MFLLGFSDLCIKSFHKSVEENVIAHKTETKKKSETCSSTGVWLERKEFYCSIEKRRQPMYDLWKYYFCSVHQKSSKDSFKFIIKIINLGHLLFFRLKKPKKRHNKKEDKRRTYFVGKTFSNNAPMCVGFSSS